MRRPRKQYPSLRRGLQTLHTDLLSIHCAIDPLTSEFPDELSTFERCVLVLEDRRFFKHMGIDWIRLVREIAKALTFQKHGGASTLDMQFVRTVTGYREPNFRRKAYEMILAYIIQHRYPKISILRSYLDVAYFGTGLIGSTSASYGLFGRHPTSLNLDDAANLASMLVFPRPRVPTPEWERKHLRRSNYIKSIYIRRENRFDELQKRIFS